MKADVDDRFYRQKKQSNKPIWVVAIILITSCLWALAYLYVPRFHIHFDKQSGSITITPRTDSPKPVSAVQIPVQSRTPQAATAKPVTPPEHKVESSERAAPIKQTVFNDANYVPRGAVNSMAPPSQVAYSQPQRVQQRTQPQTRYVHSGRWEWDQGHDKKKVWGRFEWVEVNGFIEWGSVCQNYRKGSIIYRDCRKGAKVALINMCGSYEPACMAQNGFRP